MYDAILEMHCVTGSKANSIEYRTQSTVGYYNAKKPMTEELISNSHDQTKEGDLTVTSPRMRGNSFN